MVDGANSSRLENRRALEALRNGVPNGDAVAVLGCSQPEVEHEFNSLLSRVPADGDVSQPNFGMLVSGEFGSGKSHLLGYLEARALEQNFVCSRVVISKETPLFDMGKSFKAAVENGRVPGITGHMTTEIVLKMNYDSQGYTELFKWANRDDNGLHRILPATLMLRERARDETLTNEIVEFWSGGKIGLKSIRDGLREIGQSQSFQFRAPPAKDLPPQRLRFMLELIKAAGYRGWVVLMDEIELVGTYSPLQRARSYAELSRWMGQAADEQYPGLILVGTITADFASAVLEDRGDRANAAVRLRTRGREEDGIAAARVETGMRIIERSVHPLVEPNDEMLSGLYLQLKAIHSESYGWAAPDLGHGIGEGGRRIVRSFVRRWINEWDLRRLYPQSEPDIEETELEFSYEEDAELEQAQSDDTEP